MRNEKVLPFQAWKQARKKAEAAGIVKMKVEAFERREDELLGLIHEKLKPEFCTKYRSEAFQAVVDSWCKIQVKAGTNHFKPARRVLILKEGT